MINKLKSNLNTENTFQVPRENILRAIEKDNEFVHFITEKIVNILETFSDCFSFINVSSLTSDKIEAISKFCLYFFSYLNNKKHQTPGEEYCLYIKNSETFKSKLIIYIFLYSFGNLILRYIYDCTGKYINRLQNKMHLISLNSEKTILTLESKYVFVFKKLFEKTSMPNFDDIIEKLYEYQLMQFFLNRKYHSWLENKRR
jgi:hypothetical protein